ncbi:hypothetical protein HPP92_004033 [Vanilla planifolia]|uniref:Plant heme peroxidase family profile domain-containing protein n=1 Tax=Vanilla planifolia TaxID=51239 RepID=A0A835VHS3_VANPL|nr:hypothetical protein HPP92_004033 [Vanilla planifolia]
MDGGTGAERCDYGESEHGEQRPSRPGVVPRQPGLEVLSKGAERTRHDGSVRGPHHRPGAVPILPAPHLQRHQHQSEIRGFQAGNCPNLLGFRGLLHSDQELFNNGTQDALVRQYARNRALFYSDFVAAMVRMGAISPLTGTNGEIRLNCRKVNS